MSNVEHTRCTTRRLAGPAALAAIGFPALWHKRWLHWGTTQQEQVREMPGDDLLPSAAVVSTRAVTIDAPASTIWPWLVQMGPGRRDQRQQAINPYDRDIPAI